ncbi:hypothetical protein GJ697_01265 [Pseudoduganella sp. FT25W]|uniref:O-antigen ligase domain-containing protein n=1 Tax=Duganella alba TaxID=2666081 RepID=A0A6L5QA38_9BURK|nr:hypothetical protein [Duganella alba]MRX06460.1 hypothetical protein [Duganella alba]MRX14854.1 hypothetical protein [Duganella alba]
MPMRATWPKLVAVAFFAGLGWSLMVYPLAGNWLGFILAAYAALLWWRPDLWLFALPALLPVLDLAPRTGWFFLEELDLLLMLTAGMVYWRWPQAATDLPQWPRLFRLGLLVMALAVVIGLWRGLRPLQTIDVNTFNNYLSPANALRIAKGWLWTLVLLPPLRHAAGPQLQGLRQYLLPGMMLGLLLVTAAAIRERMQFPGLLNFSSDYRISAPFSAMHTGGAALDGYLALATPLLALWLFDRHSPLRNIAAVLLLPIACYAGLATFSRGLYLGLAIAVTTVAAATVLRRPAVLATGLGVLAALDICFRIGGYRAYGAALLGLGVLAVAMNRRHAVPALAGVLVLSAAVPIYHGYYVNERFSTVGSDWSARVRHWRQALGMMDDGAVTAFLGMGTGAFPATYYWRNPLREVPPSYQFVDQGGNRHLRLAAGEYAAGYGELLRILQAVDVAPHRQYVLGVDVWNGGRPGFLHLNLCQRQLLYPQTCVAAPLRQIPAGQASQHYLYTIDSGLLGSDGLPVKLEIAAEGQQVVLDVDNVSLRTVPDGRELLHNGSFSAANDYWFFSSDRSHLPWHIKNLGLNLYFDMGWLGLCGYALLILGAATALLRRGDTAWLAALLAFQAVGLFDSLIDVPRITLLSTLLMCAAALQTRNSL